MSENDDIINWLDKNKDRFVQISDKIWEFAEPRFEEVKSAKLQIETLKEEGFTVTQGVADMPTAFIGSYGTEGSVVAILGEYDALSELSQVPDSLEKKPLVEGKCGHGCGHHLLGVGSLAAAIAVKNELENRKLPGIIRYYGCPAEEGGSGKTFMVREGLFKDVDIALCWHPFSMNFMFSVSTLANVQAYFRFTGKSAHAAAAPHLGRSALDAVELMNVGVNYLREHIISEARVHYAVTNTGGNAPNVVQANAEVLYLIRAPTILQVNEIYERVQMVAKGAAMMTGTEVEVVFDKAASNFIPNDVVGDVLFKHFQKIGGPKFTDEEREYAKKLRNTFQDAGAEVAMFA
ncbi:MAG: amidohydrolase, partial [Promethearchaeota archaeon]